MKNKIMFTVATLGTLGIAGLSLANAQSIPGATPLTGSVNGASGTHSRPVLTDAQKAIMTQAKALFKAGNATGAKALLTANGINFGGHMGGRGGGMENMKKVDDAIASGNFATFQTLSANTPFAKIDQATFNLLTPQFVAKQAAETQIQSILKNAGITFGPKTN